MNIKEVITTATTKASGGVTLSLEAALMAAVAALSGAIAYMFRHVQKIREEHINDLRKAAAREAEITAKYEARMAEMERRVFDGKGQGDA